MQHGEFMHVIHHYIFFGNPALVTAQVPHTSMGGSYNLCVAAHYFLWTALTLLAFGAGYVFSLDRNATN